MALLLICRTSVLWQSSYECLLTRPRISLQHVSCELWRDEVSKSRKWHISEYMLLCHGLGGVTDCDACRKGGDASAGKELERNIGPCVVTRFGNRSFI